ncbi:MAG TPA: GNAT family N-acetyltransferase [Actinomycetota bacterium]|nr:GNAT family N-acetyltransferase [Actinomycetota bacterium]
MCSRCQRPPWQRAYRVCSSRQPADSDAALIAAPAPPTGLRARIEDVVVDERARGQGVGTALTVAALDLAGRRGARSVDLTSRASRVAANRLYRQLGFRLRDSNVDRYQPQRTGPAPRS